MKTMQSETSEHIGITEERGEPGVWRRIYIRLRERRNWPIVAGLLVLVIILIVVLWPSKKPSAAEEEAEVIVSVKVAKVERQSISSEATAIGTILPRHEATVAAKIAGQIRKMGLMKNRPVNAGDVIAELESRDIQAQRAEAAAALEEARVNLRNVSSGTIPQTRAQDEKALRDARANVENARAVYERRLKLFEQGGISKKDLDASQLALTTAENDLRLAEATSRLHATTMSPNDRALAEARVKQAEDRLANIDTQLSYTTIRAPYSGIITDQFQYQGEFAAVGAKLFTIADVSEVIVKAPFPDTVSAELNIGDPAKVLPQDSPGTELVGAVSLVSRASDPQNRTVEIWVNLKNEGGRLRSDAAAKVVVSTRTAESAIVVPASAVTLEAANADAGTVMVVDEDSVAHERKVRVGIRAPDRVEIVSGLEEGETIVIEGNYALPDKAKVKVSEGEEKEESPEKK